mmetsp:Transcript_8528/g.19960  ORF Transcript_8528/g.19960 Transcript_8528/m.19960 type:complete len:261 (+) Transcript_8528:267-1049(+)
MPPSRKRARVKPFWPRYCAIRSARPPRWSKKTVSRPRLSGPRPSTASAAHAIHSLYGSHSASAPSAGSIAFLRSSSSRKSTSCSPSNLAPASLDFSSRGVISSGTFAASLTRSTCQPKSLRTTRASPGSMRKATKSTSGTISPGEIQPRSPPRPLDSHALTDSASVSNRIPSSSCATHTFASSSVSTRIWERCTRVAATRSDCTVPPSVRVVEAIDSVSWRACSSWVIVLLRSSWGWELMAAVESDLDNGSSRSISAHAM